MSLIERLLKFLVIFFKSIKYDNYSFKGAFYHTANKMLKPEEYPVAYHLAIEALKNYGKVKLIKLKLCDFIDNDLIAEGLASLILLIKNKKLLEEVNILLKNYGIPYNVNLILSCSTKELNKMKMLDRVSYEYSLPIWFVNKVIRLLGYEESLSLFKSYLERDVVWLRVNTLKISIDKAIRHLESLGVYVEEDKDFPEVLGISERYLRKVALSSLVKNYEVFIQDKASIAAVYALDPHPDEVILDMCAAPGLKTTMIAQYMENKGKIVAVDISKRRVRELVKIIRKSNAKNVHVMIADSRLDNFKAHFDKALLDAPCSSSGAISIDPSLRVRLERTNIPSLIRVQEELLLNAINLSEITVYCVCSILPEEGEKVIDYTLGKVKLLRLSNIPGTKGYPGYYCSPFVRRLFPHIHRTQGFFIAKLLKLEHA